MPTKEALPLGGASHASTRMSTLNSFGTGTITKDEPQITPLEK